MKRKQLRGGVPAAFMRECIPGNRLGYSVITTKPQISEVYSSTSLIMANTAGQSQVKHSFFKLIFLGT